MKIRDKVSEICEYSRGREAIVSPRSCKGRIEDLRQIANGISNPKVLYAKGINRVVI